jgi:predicted nucleic-acid-binding Zn-ribbon protein
VKIDFGVTFSIDISEPTLKTMTQAFFELSRKFLGEFFQRVVEGFADYYMGLEEKPFNCERCGNSGEFTWKTRKGKGTKLLTIFGVVGLRQLQVRCRRCGHKMYLLRKLLGVEPKVKVPRETVRKLGLLGALASYRVAQKIVGMFGWALDRMTIWRSVQRVGKEIQFDVDPKELAMGQADGTGIPIQGIRKRGKELKVFVQLKKRGGVRVAGVAIGKYEGEWEKLFGPLINGLKRFKQFLLVTDGDTSILKGLGNRVKVIFQRCLWHIPHQFKWYLWKDGVKRKTTPWVHALAELLEICALRSLVDDQKVIRQMVASKEKRLSELIGYCRQREWNNCVSYLENAAPDMFTAVLNRLQGKTVSLVERVMRTINLRINVGKWSVEGALNATKVRLAYYYNGFDA